MSPKPPLTYSAYLLRLWRDSEQSPWRASLEDAQSGERHGFADLEQLFSFLRRQAERAPGSDADTNHTID